MRLHLKDLRGRALEETEAQRTPAARAALIAILALTATRIKALLKQIDQ